MFDLVLLITLDSWNKKKIALDSEFTFYVPPTSTSHCKHPLCDLAIPYFWSFRPTKVEVIVLCACFSYSYLWSSEF